MRTSFSGALLLGALLVTGVGPAAQASPRTDDARAVVASSAASQWTCRWAPTMDHNWHNDALCSNGVKQVRPYLRPGDTYITQDELMRSARAWAAARNRGR
ncbi:hypothetical protein [Nocardioides sp.]|uniref:hypothetical protein n=1 Tax=Nocardioides sp. TaxID=35761 RepID=UPI0035AEF62E